VLVKTRDRTYERMAAAEELDADADGIPDVYQRPGRTE
jgi:Na+:H+ antiporter, NhaA family